ncbi:20158_t:CDS:2, partial [Racocetra persica]
EINADLIDLLGSFVDNNKEKITNKSQEELEDTKMGPNSTFDCFSDLESRDIDQNHNWINDFQQYYSNINFEEANSFVSNYRKLNNEIQDNETSNNNIDYQTLNNNQKIIFK